MKQLCIFNTQRTMRKLLLMILVLALLAININCGGGGGSSTNTSGRTTVTINIGETRTASHASGKLLSTASTIPSDVTSIKFTISATDMATIEWVISVAGRTTISESFEVSTGANRHFLVEAIGASGKVLYRGETFANLDGTPITLTIVMVSTDKTPPTFEGIISATAKSTTEIELSWTAATDNITLQDKIQYLIYMSTTSNGENFALPSFTTSPGVTSFSVTRLSPDTTYYFMVRAMDERGNIDTNLFEKFATTLAPPDIIKPTFGGIISATAVSSTEINLSWGSATDDRTASSNIVYLIYMSTTSQGQNFAIPTASITGGTSKTITGLTPSTTYHFVVRAKDEAGNIDTNTDEESATTPAPPDTIPPTFGGIVSATAISSTEINLSWGSATDDRTASSNIVYLIYMSTTSGGQNFAIPTASITGGTSKTITGLTPGTTYYFVVRARDASGNIDTNTVEMSATTFFSGSGEVTDSIGDVASDDRVPISPDLASAIIAVSSSSMTINVRFTPGTFNPNTTSIGISLDTDQNPSTGHPGVTAGGQIDSGIIGSDYIIYMGSDYYGNQAKILRYAGTLNNFDTVGYVPVTYVDNGMDVTAPLSMIGDDDGRLNFKVISQTQISSDGFTGILDCMPDFGLPAGIVQ